MPKLFAVSDLVSGVGVGASQVLVGDDGALNDQFSNFSLGEKRSIVNRGDWFITDRDLNSISCRESFCRRKCQLPARMRLRFR